MTSTDEMKTYLGYGSVSRTDLTEDDGCLLYEEEERAQESDGTISPMALRLSKTILLSAGSLIMDAGNKMMALPEFFDYYDMDIKGLDSALIVLSVLCAIQINALTRGSAVWQLFSSKDSEKKVDTILKEVKAAFQKRGFIGKGLYGFIALIAGLSGAMVIGGRTFSGSDTFFKALGLENKIARYAINSYMTLSSVTAFCAFSLKIFARNVFYIADKMGIPNDKNSFSHAALTTLLRTIGQTLIANYVLKTTLNQIGLTPLIGQEAASIGAATVSLTATGLFSISRGVDIYRESQTKVAGNALIQAEPKRSCKKDVARAYIHIIGALYIVFYYMMTCSALLDSEKEAGIPTEPGYMNILNLVLLALGSAVVENEYLVEKVHKTVTAFFAPPKQNECNIQEIVIDDDSREIKNSMSNGKQAK